MFGVNIEAPKTSENNGLSQQFYTTFVPGARPRARPTQAISAEERRRKDTWDVRDVKDSPHATWWEPRARLSQAVGYGHPKLIQGLTTDACKSCNVTGWPGKICQDIWFQMNLERESDNPPFIFVGQPPSSCGNTKPLLIWRWNKSMLESPDVRIKKLLFMDVSPRMVSESFNL